MIPKVGTPADLYAVDALVTAVEAAKGRTQARRPRGHHRDRAGLRQRARDRRRLAAPAGDEPRRRRLRRLDGDADHRHRRHPGRLLHARRRRSEAARPPLYGDPWHGGHRRHRRRLPRQRRAAGRRPLRRLLRPRRLHRPGPPRGDPRHGRQVGDPPEPGRRSPTRSSPRPRPRSPRRARSSPPWPEAEAKGQGAVTYKGRLIDIASARQAQVIVKMAELIAG